MQVCAIQFDIASGDPARNRSEVERFVRSAAGAHPRPDVIILPEMWNTAYSLDNIESLADVDGEPTRSMMSRLSSELAVNIVAGSIADSRGGKVYNTTYVFDRRGDVIAQYSKIHLFSLMREGNYLEAGDTPVAVDIDGVCCGLIICYDLRFPELARSLAVAGAHVLFVPAQWPDPRLEHWRTLLIARAVENQMYVVGCNRVGTGEGACFPGHSMIVDPWGVIAAEAPGVQTVLTSDLDPAAVEAVRARLPVFKDRRPGVYTRIRRA